MIPFKKSPTACRGAGKSGWWRAGRTGGDGSEVLGPESGSPHGGKAHQRRGEDGGGG